MKTLNLDIKALLRKALLNSAAYDVRTNQGKSIDFYYDCLENEIKPEIKRLYYLDTCFEKMNKKSVLILLRLNLKYRAIDLHLFGINIDERIL